MEDNQVRKTHVLPQYPVILSQPTSDQIIANFSTRDYLKWGGMVAAAVPIGLLIGKPLPKQTVAAACFLTTIAGGLASYLNSSGRLKGWLPNDREVQLYDLESDLKKL